MTAPEPRFIANTARSTDFAQALDDQLCVPCILCNCQGCDVCIPYGAWTPADRECVCGNGEAR